MRLTGDDLDFARDTVAGAMSEDAKREQWEDDHPPPEGVCPDCDATWRCTEEWVYGDDADGNRGIKMQTWTCANGHEIAVAT